MVHRKFSIARSFPLRRSLRPSSIHYLQPRPFTQNAQLLLIAPIPQRPQLPFLYPSSGIDLSSTLPRNSFQKQLSRLLTTENQSYLRTNVKKGLTWGAYAWLFSALITLCLFGFNSERLERIYPTPPEWSLISRHRYRAACGNENPEENSDDDVDYANQGARYRKLLARLENPKIDGAGLRAVAEDDRFAVKGVGQTVFDISSKSEAWREGYFGCLMGAGHAAERLDGWVHDITRDVVFPPEVVIGPSNLRPKPIPAGAASAPLEKNCVGAFEEPGVYYSRILETRTFTTRQRLEAALAWADWLGYKNSPAAAKEMCDLGLQIAVTGLPSGAGNVVDMKSGVIHDTAEYVSSNLLLATTAIGRHHAQGNNLSAALPIFLSVLRARRRLAPKPPLQEGKPLTPPAFSLWATIHSILNGPSYPRIPPSGNEQAYRTPISICEEAGMMINIGEIFFASSLNQTPFPNHFPPPSSSSSSSSFLSKALSFFSSYKAFSASKQQTQNPEQPGLNWTRDALVLAETTLLSATAPKKKIDTSARTKCVECLDAGMENWAKMVGRMLREAHTARRSRAVAHMGGGEGRPAHANANELARAPPPTNNTQTPNTDATPPGRSANWVWKDIPPSNFDPSQFSQLSQPSPSLSLPITSSPDEGQGIRERTPPDHLVDMESEENLETIIQEAQKIQTEIDRLETLFRRLGIAGRDQGGGGKGRGREWGLLNR